MTMSAALTDFELRVCELFDIKTKPELDITLKMLSAREQLMEDIISIISEGTASGHICEESTDMLQTLLCDAVCRNFPKQTNS